MITRLEEAVRSEMGWEIKIGPMGIWEMISADRKE
jgi:hypothetical protein